MEHRHTAEHHESAMMSSFDVLPAEASLISIAGVGAEPSERSGIRLAGGLLVGGFLINAVATIFHPSGDEDNHTKIFSDYADSGGWEATHLGQLLGVLTALAGLLVLYRLLGGRGEWPVLAGLGAAAAVITGATIVVLQAVDGVALKQAVDSWVASSGAEKVDRFDNAEAVRWLEWGIQSYFRVMLGVTFALIGIAIAFVRLLPRWFGWLAVAVGALSIAAGIDVGYRGLESGFQDVTIPAFQLAALAFAIGVLVSGVRSGGPAPTVTR